MSHDSIRIDEAVLRKNLSAYLKSPAAEAIFDEFDTPWWLCAVGAAILFVSGVLMLPTVIWTLAGLKAIWSVIRLEQFSVLAKNTRRHPETLHALIGYGIIIGPDERHALVVGSFRPTTEYSADWLAKKAALFGEMYSSVSMRQEDENLCNLLRDDAYRVWRRRRVPEPFAEGTELYLFDVEVDLREGQETPYDVMLFAFVATPGEKGEIMQLPWKVADAAVLIRA